MPELTDAEREVLVKDGLRLDAEPQSDPLAATMTQFAALMSTSLTTKEAARWLDVPDSRVRQMVAERTLYGVLLNSRRRIPAFQGHTAQPRGAVRCCERPDGSNGVLSTNPTAAFVERRKLVGSHAMNAVR